MSVTAVDLLGFADVLYAHLVVSEACHRAVVGKAYYAAYHDSLQWHDALSAPGALALNGSNGTHDQLFQRLSNPSDPLVKITSKKRAYALRALHEKRVIADYKLEQSVSLDDASQALANAKIIIALN